MPGTPSGATLSLGHAGKRRLDSPEDLPNAGEHGSDEILSRGKKQRQAKDRIVD